MSVPTYLAGMAYERLVNRFDALARFRIVMIAVLRKPAEPGDGTRGASVLPS